MRPKDLRVGGTYEMKGGDHRRITKLEWCEPWNHRVALVLYASWEYAKRTPAQSKRKCDGGVMTASGFAFGYWVSLISPESLACQAFVNRVPSSHLHAKAVTLGSFFVSLARLFRIREDRSAANAA